MPLIVETNRIIQLAEAGNWPPINDDEIDLVARGWWDWFVGAPVERWVSRCGGNKPLDPHEWALAGEDDLSRSVQNFLAGPRTWLLQPRREEDLLAGYHAENAALLYARSSQS